LPRLDLYLLEAGLCRSRSLAARLIREGAVTVNGRGEKKCGFFLKGTEEVKLSESPLTHYVSRGALKLVKALDVFPVSVAGKVCADVGASTGGFTQLLLERGAQRVYAVDSGKDQLAKELRKDKRVRVMEEVNARYLTEADVEPVDLAVMDVSFISQALIYPALSRILKKDGILISLIKPQFEVGRGEIGSGGIVKSEKARLSCIEELKKKAAEAGLILRETLPSPITGGDGNVEYLAFFTFDGGKE